MGVNDGFELNLFPNHVLRSLIDADVNAAHIFADETEQEHDHAADKQKRREKACVTDRRSCERYFFVDHKKTSGKSNDSAKDADERGGAQRFDGKGGKTVHPKSNQSGDCVAGFALQTVAVANGNVP